MKAIIFDLWGTLAYVKGNNFLKQLLNSFNVKYSPENVKAIEHILMKDNVSDEDICRRLKNTLDADMDDDKFKDLCDMRLNQTKLFEGIYDMLLALKKDYKLFLLSNTYDIEDIISIKKIVGLFDDIFVSYKTGHLKPDPQAFKDVLEKHYLDAKDVLMVGDNRVIDGASEKVGIKFMHINDFKELFRRGGADGLYIL